MKKKSSSAGFGAVIAIILFAFLMNVSEDSNDSVVLIVMAVVLFASAFTAAKNAKKAKAEKSEIDRIIADAPQHLDCDYGNYNCDFSHDNDERIRQLGEFLKNGIIDKKEYQLLLKKYNQQY